MFEIAEFSLFYYTYFSMGLRISSLTRFHNSLSVVTRVWDLLLYPCNTHTIIFSKVFSCHFQRRNKLICLIFCVGKLQSYPICIHFHQLQHFYFCDLKVQDWSTLFTQCKKPIYFSSDMRVTDILQNMSSEGKYR